MSQDQAKKIAAEIAKEYLDIITLTPRNRDHLDFHEVHVTTLEKALVFAFEKGRDAEYFGDES